MSEIETTVPTHVCPRGEESPHGPIREMSLKAHYRGGRCSYCGSMSEDDFFSAVDAGAEIGPTDKSYKVYVTGAGHSHAKFYFQHLSDSGRDKFIDAVNAKRMKFGFPGHLYVMPFFCAPISRGPVNV
jgi:hypothetical protein